MICLFSWTNATAQAAPDVWDILRDEFKLNHEADRPEVQEQIRWLTAHPAYIQRVCQQSEPFIYHIVNAIKRQGLPGEFALLPMIESAYDPFAYSGAGAAGLWQLMPATARELGVRQDWWFDGRRSINASTSAALKHLVTLKNHYNENWNLVIAAYDAGEGTIDKAVKNNQSDEFWHLHVPAETQVYVPRFLALAELIHHPEQYKLSIPAIPYLPYFEEVDIGSQIDLNHAARLAGMSYSELIKLNPGLNRWTTAPYKPFSLLIPANKAAVFHQNLSTVPVDKRVSWVKHQVQAGDDLPSIAARYHSTVTLIKEINLLSSDQLIPNQTLLLPGTKNTAVFTQNTNDPRSPLERGITTARNHRLIHFVQAKDNYNSLEKLYGVKKADIQEWNHIPTDSNLKPGQQLTIWKRIQPPSEYVVKSSDSLSSIAKNKNTRVSAILALNPGLNPLRPLRAGQKILVG